MATKESGVVRAIKKSLEQEFPGSVVYNIHGGIYQEAGIPDLLVCINGRFLAIEVKFQRPGESKAHAYGKVTARQSVQIERIQEAGGTAGVALSAEDAIALVNAVPGVKKRRKK